MQKILIVEDDEQNNQMLKEYLEDHGYVCTQAYSGSEAKLRFSMEEYDLVLLDLMLPGISGEELVSAFSEKAPVIVMSAKSGLDSKVEVLSAGAEDYICKPFDLPELLVRQKNSCLIFENPVSETSRPDTEQIFERFYKADSARRKGSSGLGLFIVKELAEQMNGSVKAELLKERLRITLEFGEPAALPFPLPDAASYNLTDRCPPPK